MHEENPDPPAGFEPLFRTSPFLQTIGPLFYRKDTDGFVIGMQILPKHANARGTAHGGLLLTLLDVALGYRTAFSQNPPAALTTASITADFVGSPKIGDWVEAHVDVHKIGKRLAFAKCIPGRQRGAAGTSERRLLPKQQTVVRPRAARN